MWRMATVIEGGCAAAWHELELVTAAFAVGTKVTWPRHAGAEPDAVLEVSS